ncbi:hypothetical protein ABL78_7615 [Leptomonas seymouri]|uniref:YbaK/aminoacyl-tRNA synthetase-associated domain-containing protein n=1 Tax=Leptomonas seymouri TaxID=5684 RepID=A0A0N0P2U1_LEPSE|nr:hypothetical protein ABL78_7615 [Leptomonas seymouri]|eukprot:KPI83356.1 hypothetical protein ABL78_7615 [Leptomonas seymouri]
MERCKEYFISKNASHLVERIREFDGSSATVELAAVRFNCNPAQIAKSLTFHQRKAMSKAEAKAHQRTLQKTQRQQQPDEGSDGVSASGATTGTPPDSNVVMIVVAGDAKVNTTKFKGKFFSPPRMLKHEDVEALTGHPPGGVCPFGVREGVRVFLDVSLRRFETVYPAAGTANSGLELSVDELETYASNLVEWVDVCEGWLPEGAGAAAGVTDA